MTRSLITTEMDIIYGLVQETGSDVHNLARHDVSVVAGWSDDDRVLALSSDMREVIKDEKELLTTWATARYKPGKEPPVLKELAARLSLLQPAKQIAVTGGPCFTFPGQVAEEFPCRLPLLVSDLAGRRRASRLDRPDNWEPREWAELIAGNLGSWAFAVDGSEVVSICHTPAANHEASEAGVWTRADYRGRGLAPAVVRAWWSWEKQFKYTMFYSTSSDNHASQAVARKLALKQLGWLWVARS